MIDCCMLLLMHFKPSKAYNDTASVNINLPICREYTIVNICGSDTQARMEWLMTGGSQVSI